MTRHTAGKRNIALAKPARLFRGMLYRAVSCAILLSLLVLITVLCMPLKRSDLYEKRISSVRIMDRNGSLLRESPSTGACYHTWVSLDKISPYAIKAAVASEDERFYRHRGVDPVAIIRATGQNAGSGRIVSGASTITMQVIANLFGYPTKSLRHKALEALYAMKGELLLSKNEILEVYLNVIPYGNETVGIEAASRLYFDKPASQLSLAQAAFLTALPRAPSRLNPFQSAGEAKKSQELILQKLYVSGEISAGEFREALNEDLSLVSPEGRFLAPHFCDFVISSIHRAYPGGLCSVRTTLDLEIQKDVEKILKEHIKRLEPSGVSNGAVLIIDNRTSEIRAMAGSVDFFDSAHSGQVNGCISLRQPGSTLKPFTYGLALEKGITPSEIIPDLPIHIKTSQGDFSPRNYDEVYHGPVRLRTALACSYNIPAVLILEKVGPGALLKRLRAAGFSSLSRDAAYYGPGLTLGVGEVTLLELARGYAALANNGIFRQERIYLDLRDSKGNLMALPESSDERPLFSPQVAYLLTSILSDNDARSPAFGSRSPLALPFPCAVKTGTSKAFRDNWTIGYTPDYTVGVWVGNFDGSSMRNISGITGAGPIFKEVMLHLHQRITPQNFRKPGAIVTLAICPESGEIAGPHCPNKIKEIYLEDARAKRHCKIHRAVKDGSHAGMVREVYPPEYLPWMGERGMDTKVRRPDTRKDEKEAGSPRVKMLEITFPIDEDTFAIDPHLRGEYQSIPLQAIVPETIEKVTWWIDGRKAGESESPFTFDWKLQRGAHDIGITADTGSGNAISGKKVRIKVY